RRVGGDAGEGVAAATLHADHQFRGRHRFAATLVEHLQAILDHAHDLLDHAGETAAGVLQAEQPVLLVHAVGELIAIHQLVGLQLLAAQADHQRLAAEIGVATDVVQGANRHHGVRRVDRHAAAVAVRQRHHIVDVGVPGQDFLAHALDHVIEHTDNALHGSGYAENVAGADAAVRIAETLEGVTLQRLAW